MRNNNHNNCCFGMRQYLKAGYEQQGLICDDLIQLLQAWLKLVAQI